MDTGHYSPALTYHELEAVSYTLISKDASVTELMAIPEAKAAILAEIPDFEKRISGEIGLNLGNLSLKLLADYAVIERTPFERVASRIDEMRLVVRDLYGSGKV